MTAVEQSPQRLLDTAFHLPRQVLPIYEFAEQTNPYAILVCDRDARPIGAALEAIQRARNGLPSVEDRWFYRRISKRVSSSDLVEHLRDPLVSLQATGNGSRLMVVDDYVSNSAGTLHLFRDVCRKLQVTMPVDWVTLAGKGTAYNAYPYLGPAATATWRDRADVIGIDYTGTQLNLTPTLFSEMFYAAIREGAEQLSETEA